jgi:hypothetical protein
VGFDLLYTAVIIGELGTAHYPFKLNCASTVCDKDLFDCDECIGLSCTKCRGGYGLDRIKPGKHIARGCRECSDDCLFCKFGDKCRQCKDGFKVPRIDGSGTCQAVSDQSDQSKEADKPEEESKKYDEEDDCYDGLNNEDGSHEENHGSKDGDQTSPAPPLSPGGSHEVNSAEMTSQEVAVSAVEVVTEVTMIVVDPAK